MAVPPKGVRDVAQHMNRADRSAAELLGIRQAVRQADVPMQGPGILVVALMPHRTAQPIFPFTQPRGQVAWRERRGRLRTKRDKAADTVANPAFHGTHLLLG